jgi:hypothetical protein
MIIKCSNIFLFQGPPNSTQIGIFGLKTNHLATLQLASNPCLTAMPISIKCLLRSQIKIPLFIFIARGHIKEINQQKPQKVVWASMS